MLNLKNKIVNFNDYCYRCIYSKVDEGDEPCRRCLSVPARLATHKPLKFIEKSESKYSFEADLKADEILKKHRENMKPTSK